MECTPPDSIVSIQGLLEYVQLNNFFSSGPGRTNNIRILPGEAGNISFLLTNFGTTANITIQVTATDLNNGDFSHTITPQRVLVNTFQNVEGTVTVNSLSVDAPTEGPAVRFIVTASADDDNHGDQSDFFTFDVLLEEDVRNCYINCTSALSTTLLSFMIVSESLLSTYLYVTAWAHCMLLYTPN